MSFFAIFFMVMLYLVGCFFIMMSVAAKAARDNSTTYISLAVAFTIHGFIVYFLTVWAGN